MEKVKFDHIGRIEVYRKAPYGAIAQIMDQVNSMGCDYGDGVRSLRTTQSELRLKMTEEETYFKLELYWTGNPYSSGVVHVMVFVKVKPDTVEFSDRHMSATQLTLLELENADKNIRQIVGCVCLPEEKKLYEQINTLWRSLVEVSYPWFGGN